jgi:hypothetical protein
MAIFLEVKVSKTPNPKHKILVNFDFHYPTPYDGTPRTFAPNWFTMKTKFKEALNQVRYWQNFVIKRIVIARFQGMLKNVKLINFNFI